MAPSLAHGGFDEINVMGTEPECRGRMDARERPRPSDCARVRCCFLVLLSCSSKLNESTQSDSRRKSISGPSKTRMFLVEPTGMYLRRPRKRLAARGASAQAYDAPSC